MHVIKKMDKIWIILQMIVDLGYWIVFELLKGIYDKICFEIFYGDIASLFEQLYGLANFIIFDLWLVLLEFFFNILRYLWSCISFPLKYATVAIHVLEVDIYPILEPFFRPVIDFTINLYFPNFILFDILKDFLVFFVHFVYFVVICILWVWDFVKMWFDWTICEIIAIFLRPPSD